MHVSAIYYPKYTKNWHQKTIRSQLAMPQFPLIGNYSFDSNKVFSKHINLCSSCGISSIIMYVDNSFVNHDLYKKYSEVLNNIESNISIYFMSAADDKESLDYISECHSKNYQNNLYLFANQFPVILKETHALEDTKDFCRVVDDAKKYLHHEDGDVYLIADEIKYPTCPSVERLEQVDGITGLEILPHIDLENENLIFKFARQIALIHEEYEQDCIEASTHIWASIYPRINTEYQTVKYVAHDDTGDLFKSQFENITKRYERIILNSFNNWDNDSQLEPCGNEENYGLSESLDKDLMFVTTGRSEYTHYCYDMMNILKEIRGKVVKPHTTTQIGTPIPINLPPKRSIEISFLHDGFNGFVYKAWDQHLVSYVKIEDDSLIYFKIGHIRGSVEKKVIELKRGKQYHLKITDNIQDYRFEIDGDNRIPEDLKFLTQECSHMSFFEGELQSHNIVEKIIVKDINSKILMSHPSGE